MQLTTQLMVIAMVLMGSGLSAAESEAESQPVNGDLSDEQQQAAAAALALIAVETAPPSPAQQALIDELTEQCAVMEAHWKVGDHVKAGELFLALHKRCQQAGQQEPYLRPSDLKPITNRLTTFAQTWLKVPAASESGENSPSPVEQSSQYRKEESEEVGEEVTAESTPE